MFIFATFIGSWLPLQSYSFGESAKILPDPSEKLEGMFLYLLIGVLIALIVMKALFLKILCKSVYIIAIIAAESNKT